eukprot:TRINITY_DN7105_c0_g3_i1.p1 TRINITY_DN7105_c0_g3~~TRINITY_DN7105_c0_g3_i1.p1  ORF type:complete len:354 (+),score=-1.86 TRINITY_DN7105_c0_g3_i1:159-1220(+)
MWEYYYEIILVFNAEKKKRLFKTMKATTLLLVLLMLSGTALSWSWYVHVVIYMIALETIENTIFSIPAAICPKLNGEPEEGKVISLHIDFIANCKKLAEDALKTVTLGRRRIYEAKDMYLVAAWPDDATVAPDFTPAAHYLDQFYSDSTSTPIKELPSNINVLTAVSIANNYLVNVKPDDKKENWRIPYVLANLIHLVGDMHQPMHMISYKPPGAYASNRGGHDVTIYVEDKAVNLHKYWDNAMGMITDEGKLNENTAKIYLDKAKELMKRNKMIGKLKDQDNMTLGEFAGKMFNIGIKYAYQYYKHEGKYIEFPTDTEKVIEMKKECEKLITDAGYMLAAYLSDIYFAHKCK